MDRWHDARTNPPVDQDEYLVNWTGELGFYTCKNKTFYEIIEWTPEDGWIVDDIEKVGFKNVEVVAWMRLPGRYDGNEHSCETCMRRLADNYECECANCSIKSEDKWLGGADASLSLIDAYIEAKKDRQPDYGEVIEFTCPLCGGVAQGVTESSMGHFGIACQKCKTQIRS